MGRGLSGRKTKARGVGRLPGPGLGPSFLTLPLLLQASSLLCIVTPKAGHIIVSPRHCGIQFTLDQRMKPTNFSHISVSLMVRWRVRQRRVPGGPGLWPRLGDSCFSFPFLRCPAHGSLWRLGGRGGLWDSGSPAFRKAEPW